MKLCLSTRNRGLYSVLGELGDANIQIVFQGDFEALVERQTEFIALNLRACFCCRVCLADVRLRQDFLYRIKSTRCVELFEPFVIEKLRKLRHDDIALPFCLRALGSSDCDILFPCENVFPQARSFDRTLRWLRYVSLSDT